MGMNRYECGVCGHLGDYVATKDTRPWHCDAEMVWTPDRSAAVDHAFDAFTVSNGARTFTVDSLHTLRRTEAETERMSRNRDGEALVWRDYSQDKSNGDVHTLAPGGHLDRPVTGWAEGTTGVDLKRFKKIVSDAPKDSIL